jgi:hypothetical protein
MLDDDSKKKKRDSDYLKEETNDKDLPITSLFFFFVAIQILS